MRILVTGSRSWRDFRTIRNALADRINGTITITVVHGAATGADHMARSAALALGFEEEPHFPDYAKYPPDEAPKRRNQEMVDAGADVCLAFPTPSSRGTWDCVARAKSAGIPVEVIEWSR